LRLSPAPKGLVRATAPLGYASRLSYLDKAAADGITYSKAGGFSRSYLAEDSVKSDWLTHNGQRIFHLCLKDFGLDADAFKAEIEAVEALVLQQPADSTLLLVDIRNTVMSIEIVGMMKQTAQRMQPHSRRVAVVGVKGVVKVIADSIARLTSGLETILFDDLEQAKDWLADAT
jgi:hypothetical protein